MSKNKLLTMYTVDMRFQIINGADDGEFEAQKQFRREQVATVAVQGDVITAIAEAIYRTEQMYLIDTEDALALGLEKIEGSRAVGFEIVGVTTVGKETI